MSDFYEEAARKRYQILEAAKAQSRADLARHQANDDEESAALELQALATLNDQQASLERLHRQYVAERNPPAPQPLTDKEIKSMSPERMAQHPEAIDRIFSKSKYYSKDQWSDPEVAKRAQAGIEEVQRRRKLGQ